jgi:hypothetical protein
VKEKKKKDSHVATLQRGRPKPTKLKAARIPKNELLDLLFRLFDERDAWRLPELVRIILPISLIRIVFLT